MSESKTKESPVIHVKVTVQTAVNPTTGEQEYVPKYHPEVINVTDSDTIISFRLKEPTPDDVIVTDVKPRPSDNTQLSTPSISKNGKQVVVTDINTEAVTLNLDFTFGSNKPNTKLAIATACSVSVDQYPEITNEPPP